MGGRTDTYDDSEEFSDEEESNASASDVASDGFDDSASDADSDSVDNDIDDEDCSIDDNDDDGSDDDDDDDNDDDEHGEDGSEIESDEIEADEDVQEEMDISDEATFAEINVQSEVDKGNGILAQLKLWDSILKCRINAHGAVMAMNQLPQHQDYECISSAGEIYDDAVNNTKLMLQSALSSLVELQDKLIQSNNDLSHISTMGSEEMKMEDYPEFLSERQKGLNKFRDDVLAKCSKMVLSVPSRNAFGNFETSTSAQIQQILSDKERLIKRTQRVRSLLPVIGKKQDDVAPPPQESAAASRAVYDCEIFDDGDFYNQLVMNHIGSKTANIDNMYSVSKEWVTMNRGEKNKRKVDTKASKGRKTRYGVHRKLVNYFVPAENPHLFSDEQRDALFCELFRN